MTDIKAELPPANGSLDSLCQQGDPGCKDPLAQGDPLKGYPLIEPDSMAPHLVPPGPTVFERSLAVSVERPAPVSSITFLEKTLFGFNRSTLTPEGVEALKNLVASMDLAHLRFVRVAAYTDNFGSQSYNDNLAHDRAVVVRQALESLGIPADMIYIDSIGKSDFVVSPDSCHGTLEEQKSCQAPNRRVSIETSGRFMRDVSFPIRDKKSAIWHQHPN